MHFSIYSIVRQQSEGSYQKTDVEKTERAQEIIDSTHRLTDTKWGDLPSNSLSLFARLPFLGGMAAGG